jgi:phenylacetate 2-hydroxylase
MTLPIYAGAFVVLGYLLYKLLYGTETPHIKGIPEVPGLPLIGNLIQFGSRHPKVAQELAQKYGPVYQVRFGTKVRTDSSRDMRDAN